MTDHQYNTRRSGLPTDLRDGSENKDLQTLARNADDLTPTDKTLEKNILNAEDGKAPRDGGSSHQGDDTPREPPPAPADPPGTAQFSVARKLTQA